MMKKSCLVFGFVVVMANQSQSQTPVSVPANQDWTPTGIVMNAGDVISIQANGTWNTGGGWPDHSPSGEFGGNTGMEEYPSMSLIGKIGSTEFHIGGGAVFVTPEAGRLYLGPNDGPDPDDISDNTGFLNCMITGATYINSPIQVNANQEWTDTGLDFDINVTVNVEAQGTWYSSFRQYTPWGAYGAYPGMDKSPFMCLIGKIGNSKFYIGAEATIQAQDSGELFLGPNDGPRPDCYANNSGQLISNLAVVSRKFIPGDVNGNCQANGIDVVYFVTYLKGGPPLIAGTDCEQ